MHQNAEVKLRSQKIFWGEGTASSPVGKGNPFPTADLLGTFGALIDSRPQHDIPDPPLGAGHT